MYRTVYAYHPKTHEPAGPVLAQATPLKGGASSLPPNTTLEKPPRPKRGHRVVFDVQGRTWVQIKRK